LATCPEAKVRDGKKAVEAATRACELTEAIKWQKKALESPKAFSPDELKKVRRRLELYQQSKPYREQ
jgi:hypothetical protein